MLMSKEREQDQVLPERWSAKAKSEVVLRLFREIIPQLADQVEQPYHRVLETGQP